MNGYLPHEPYRVRFTRLLIVNSAGIPTYGPTLPAPASALGHAARPVLQSGTSVA